MEKYLIMVFTLNYSQKSLIAVGMIRSAGVKCFQPSKGLYVAYEVTYTVARGYNTVAGMYIFEPPCKRGSLWDFARFGMQ